MSETSTPATNSLTGTARVKRGMAEMLKGGVIMDAVSYTHLTLPTILLV